MKMHSSERQTQANDLEVLSRYLPMRGGERILELGCGAGQTTRELAESHPGLAILATEVDAIQHDKNLQIKDLPNVTFQLGGAEAIALADSSVHYVILLKSLHHVPGALLTQSLGEIHRVLKPGGLAYISEPIADGPFNDEEVVRRNAFSALEQAVAAGMFELVEQIFFHEERLYEGFAHFEEQVLGVTHSHFEIDAPLLVQIKAAFEQHLDHRGWAEFSTPQRVDLLRRPQES